MYGNHKPEIRGTDDALWSRVQLIEFPVSFANRVNPKLPEELRKELSGILNWMLQGCYIWQCIGLLPPTKVQAATAAYRQEQDTIGQFIRERCQTGDDYMQCKASRLYAAYKSWADYHGHPVLSQKRFGVYLTAHEYPSDDNATGRGIFRKRIDLAPAPEDDSEGDETDTSANLHNPRLATMNASNGAVKRTSDANLANLDSRKTPYKELDSGFPGTKVSKVSNQPENSPYPIEKTQDNAANLPQTKVSTPLHTLPCQHRGRRAERFPDGSMLERCTVCHRIVQCTLPAE